MTPKSNSGGAAGLSLSASALVRPQKMTTHEQVEQLYQELYSPVYRYLVLTGSVAEDADELTQETFLRLFRSLHAGQRLEKPKQWLISVAHNLRYDWQERERRRPMKVELTDETARPDPSPDPETAALETERKVQAARKPYLPGMSQRKTRIARLVSNGLQRAKALSSMICVMAIG